MRFIDLNAQQDLLRDEIDKRIQTVLSHGQYILGPEVQEFEEKLAGYVGVKHTVGVSSGTDALLAVLMALNVGPGDAVFTTPFTFIATAEVISLLGATPVFVDVDSRTFNIDPEQLELAVRAVKENDPTIYPLPRVAGCERLTPKAIIPVDLFGLPADYDPIMDLAERYNLFVLEDAAQGLGGVYKSRRAGSLAHAAATSFFPAKPLGCYGDGGAVMTDDDGLADEIRSIRLHGKGKEKYDNVRIGLNARLHTIQAAVLLAKLKKFPVEVEARQEVAAEYTAALSQVEGLIPPYIPAGLQSAWAQYSILSENRGKLQDKLKDQGVPTAIYYPKPLHLQTAYSCLSYSAGNFPVCEKVSKQIISLPMHPYLHKADIEMIARLIFLEK